MGFQKQIKALAQKRRVYIEAELEKNNIDAEKSFDQVIRKTLREQAARKNIRFKD